MPAASRPRRARRFGRKLRRRRRLRGSRARAPMLWVMLAFVVLCVAGWWISMDSTFRTGMLVGIVLGLCAAALLARQHFTVANIVFDTDAGLIWLPSGAVVGLEEIRTVHLDTRGDQASDWSVEINEVITVVGTNSGYSRGKLVAVVEFIVELATEAQDCGGDTRRFNGGGSGSELMAELCSSVRTDTRVLAQGWQTRSVTQLPKGYRVGLAWANYRIRRSGKVLVEPALAVVGVLIFSMFLPLASIELSRRREVWALGFMLLGLGSLLGLRIAAEAKGVLVFDLHAGLLRWPGGGKMAFDQITALRFRFRETTYTTEDGLERPSQCWSVWLEPDRREFSTSEGLSTRGIGSIVAYVLELAAEARADTPGARAVKLHGLDTEGWEFLRALEFGPRERGVGRRRLHPGWKTRSREKPSDTVAFPRRFERALRRRNKLRVGKMRNALSWGAVALFSMTAPFLAVNHTGVRVFMGVLALAAMFVWCMAKFVRLRAGHLVFDVAAGALRLPGGDAIFFSQIRSIELSSAAPRVVEPWGWGEIRLNDHLLVLRGDAGYNTERIAAVVVYLLELSLKARAELPDAPPLQLEGTQDFHTFLRAVAAGKAGIDPSSRSGAPRIETRAV